MEGRDKMKTIPKEKRCSEPKVSDVTGWHSYQCSRRGTITEDGKPWCFQHAPSAVHKRNAEVETRFKADQDRRMTPYYEAERLRAVNTKLLEALEYTTAVLAGVMDILPLGVQASARVQVEAARAVIEEARK
jgi:hypothetical protein